MDVAEVLSRGPALVLIHNQGDPDALASACLMADLCIDPVVGVFGDLNYAARQVADALSVDYRVDPDLPDEGVIIVVDTSSPEMLGTDASVRPDLVVDHHYNARAWGDTLYFVDETRPSCTEVVLRLWREIGRWPSERMALIALIGIIADTARFRHADSITLRTAADLLDASSFDLSSALSMIEFEYQFDLSRRIANLKGLQRMSYQKIGDTLIAWTNVGAFEGSVAKLLLLAGADVAFVASDKKEGARISARAKPEIVMSGLHLGRIMSDLGSEVEGAGGGHAGAAGIVVRDDLGEVLRLCIERTARSIDTIDSRRDKGET